MSTHLVVMAGGSGTRFWPKSTSRNPKQLLAFEGLSELTLLQQTLERFRPAVPSSRQWIVTTTLLGEAVSAQASGARVLQEPQGRNTAPCIYWAAREIEKLDPQGIMMVMPADHFMKDVAAFQSTVERAVAWAASHDDLVTLGIRPSRPETGYGYLKTGAEVAGGGPLRVEAFVEKPDLARAEQFVKSGSYLWNGGMFVWKVSAILKEFDRLMPEMRGAWEACSGDVAAAYPKMTATSIDFGIMEKASSVVTFPLECGWDDLGSWTSVELLANEQGRGRNWGTALGGQVVAVESTGLVVDAPGRTIATLGVQDLIIVDSGKVILVADKSRAQDIKKLVDAVKASKPELA
jgi:mannose-1-phosphate guanylyltransferase